MQILPIELQEHVFTCLFSSNPSLVQLSKIRRLNAFSKETIDNYISSLIQRQDTQVLKSLGVGHHAVSTLHFASSSWSTFMYCASKKCCICRKKFNGQIRSIGVFAHDECIKSKCISTTYLCRPFSKAATERVSSNVIHALNMRASLTETLITSYLPSISWNGYSKYFGEFTYTQVFVGPHVPMLQRNKTLLGWLYDTDDELLKTIDIEKKWIHFYDNKAFEEECKRKRKNDELEERRLHALKARQEQLQKWLNENCVDMNIDDFKSVEPLSSFFSKTVKSVVTFSRIKNTILYLQKVQMLQNELNVDLKFMLSLPLPSNEQEWLQFSTNIKKKLDLQMEAEKYQRETEERNAKRIKASKQFKDRNQCINSFIASDSIQFEFLPMNNYERRKIQEYCERKRLLTKSEGEGELRRLIVYKSDLQS